MREKVIRVETHGEVEERNLCDLVTFQRWVVTFHRPFRADTKGARERAIKSS